VPIGAGVIRGEAGPSSCHLRLNRKPLGAFVRPVATQGLPTYSTGFSESQGCPPLFAMQTVTEFRLTTVIPTCHHLPIPDNESTPIAAATVQGLRGHRADEGDLASMTTINSKSHGVQIFTEGHRLRWTKQMALRGRGRFYDGDGMCGKQRLVISNDLRSFTANVSRLFPDATLKTLGDCSEDDTWSERVIKKLSDTKLPSEVTSTHLSRLLDRKWGTISTRVLTDGFHRSLSSIGWLYVPGKGRRGSIFKRTSMAISQAA
jgi:hypothetical protein